MKKCFILPKGEATWKQGPTVPNARPARYIEVEKSWGNKDIVARYVDSNLLAPQVHPAHEKSLAVTLYTMDLSLSAIVRLFHISIPAVLRWVRNFAERVSEKPEPGEVVIAELDEMWHFLKSKKTLDLESLLSRYRTTHRMGMWRA